MKSVAGEQNSHGLGAGGAWQLGAGGKRREYEESSNAHVLTRVSRAAFPSSSTPGAAE